jgi:hypothetical protein
MGMLAKRAKIIVCGLVNNKNYDIQASNEHSQRMERILNPIFHVSAQSLIIWWANLSI